MTSDDTRRAVLDMIGECYGGAFTSAWVHGWRYGGEVTADDWPKKLIDAFEVHEAAVREEVWATLTTEIANMTSETVPIPRDWWEKARRAAEAT